MAPPDPRHGQVLMSVQSFVDRETAHLREVISLESKLKDAALQIQHVEYQRRLDELNNAHARAEKAVQVTVPRETFDVFVTEHNKWKEETKTAVDRANGATAANARTFYIITTLMGLLFGVLAFWLKSK